MLHRKYIRHAGFTLLETLVAISIIATVAALIVQVFFTTARSNTKTELLKDVKQNGDYALEIMSRMIRNAIDVQTVCAAGGSDFKSFTIENPDGGVTTLGCNFGNSVTRIASVSAANPSAEYLTSTDVTMGGSSCNDSAMTLKFHCVGVADAPPEVTIQFTLSQRGTAATQLERASASFQTTVAPRY